MQASAPYKLYVHPATVCGSVLQIILADRIRTLLQAETHPSMVPRREQSLSIVNLPSDPGMRSI